MMIESASFSGRVFSLRSPRAVPVLLCFPGTDNKSVPPEQRKKTRSTEKNPPTIRGRDGFRAAAASIKRAHQLETRTTRNDKRNRNAASRTKATEETQQWDLSTKKARRAAKKPTESPEGVSAQRGTRTVQRGVLSGHRLGQQRNLQLCQLHASGPLSFVVVVWYPRAGPTSRESSSGRRAGNTRVNRAPVK